MIALSVFAAVPVRDLDVAVEWWDRFVGRVPDERPAPHIAEYYLTADRDPTRGTVQLNAGTPRAGGGLVTVNVADLDGLVEEAHARGISVVVDDSAPSGVRVGTTTDIDGNVVVVVQPPR